MGLVFYEMCAGSAALSLHLISGGVAQPPAPYMGSKRTYAAHLLELMGLRAGQSVDQLVLVEPGPWAAVWQAFAAGRGLQLAEIMEPWCYADDAGQEARFAELAPQVVRGQLHGDHEAAAWLWCLVRARMGAARNGRLYWLPRRVRERVMWREVSPMHFVRELAPLAWPPTTVLRQRAAQVQPTGGAVVYIDPPYANMDDGYLHAFAPDQVRHVAQRWHAAGSRVFVSERRPTVPGWRVVQVRAQKDGARGGAWSGRMGELLTCSPEPKEAPRVRVP